MSGEGAGLSLMEYRIQSLVFPAEEKHLECRELFFRGNAEVLPAGKDPGVRIGAGEKIDFTTYLNGCTWSKWRKVTGAGRLTVHLEISGSCEVAFIGWSLKEEQACRKVYDTVFVSSREERAEKISFSFPSVPENSEEALIAGFEISAAGDCVLRGGYYTVEVSPECLNPVELCIATTTFRNEDLIRRNAELIREELLSDAEGIGSHLYLHVVDNGRTLKREEMEGEHIFLHPNGNSGGAGGFARGMIESVNQVPGATHVLLMDDDVMVLPESIRRTYHLLRLLKPEYRNHFISGAMLFLEEPWQQYEDIGTLGTDGSFKKRKPNIDHRRIEGNLRNEAEWSRAAYEYAGWWYCCIPAAVIRKQGYPLPVFIRCDDVEYSIRAGAEILTLNGICTWHRGFFRRFNPAVDYYQRCRNLLIAKACTEKMESIDAEGLVKSLFRTQMLKYRYGSAELVLRALEDFLKGPDFLRENRGEGILRENSKLNDPFVPLKEFPEIRADDLSECLRDAPRKRIHTLLYRLTYNGHRFWPKALLKKEPAVISFDHTYQPEKMTLRRFHLMVNPYTETGAMLELDRERYRKLTRRYSAAIRSLGENREELFRQYREAKPELTGEAFWRKYLEITKI